jgi:hypothetical protein
VFATPVVEGAQRPARRLVHLLVHQSRRSIILRRRLALSRANRNH